MKMTPKEMELLDDMIQQQLTHAARCDTMGSHMAEKQRGWELERVTLLTKLKLMQAEGPDHETQNTEIQEFRAYCDKYPEQRFWQAIRNWSGFSFVYVSDDPVEDATLKDSFYFVKAQKNDK